MKVTCPSCRRAIVAEDIDIHRGIAICAACRCTFSFQDRLPRPAPLVVQAPAVEADDDIARPPQVRMTNNGGRLQIAVRQPLGGGMIMIVLGGIVTGCMVAGLYGIFARRDQEPMPIAFWLISHVEELMGYVCIALGGLVLLYLGLSTHTHQVIFDCYDQHLVIRRQGFGWSRTSRMPINQIVHIQCARHLPDDLTSPEVLYIYLADGTVNNPLFATMPGVGRYIAQELQRRLGLTDPASGRL
jgi:hypothetical protein